MKLVNCKIYFSCYKISDRFGDHMRYMSCDKCSVYVYLISKHQKVFMTFNFYLIDLWILITCYKLMKLSSSCLTYLSMNIKLEVLYPLFDMAHELLLLLLFKCWSKLGHKIKNCFILVPKFSKCSFWHLYF